MNISTTIADVTDTLSDVAETISDGAEVVAEATRQRYKIALIAAAVLAALAAVAFVRRTSQSGGEAEDSPAQAAGQAAAA